MSRPVTIAWSRQAWRHTGWVDVELLEATPFCCLACQSDWLAAHPGALGPYQDLREAGWRRVGQPGCWLDETDYDLWCAACGVLIQLGLQEPPCPASACPPVVVNRLPHPEGERCVACGRFQQLPASLVALGGRP